MATHRFRWIGLDLNKLNRTIAFAVKKTDASLSAPITIDIAFDETAKNAAEDLEEAMLAQGWEFDSVV